ncbi:MAG: putative RND superfamily exporter protein, partial [Myxococcota bacterium]
MIRESLGRALVRHRYAALVILLFITALAGLGIANRLQQGAPIDFTPQAIFIDSGPMITRLREIEQTFGREDNDLLLLLDGPALTTPAGEEALRSLYDAVYADPDVVSVTSLLQTPLMRADDGLLIIEPALEGRDMAAALVAAAEDPYLRGLMVSADQQTTALRVRVDPALTRVAELAPVIHRLTDTAQAISLPDGLVLLATGVPFVRTEVVDMMIQDEAFFMPVTALMFAITICVLFRRVLLGIAPLIAVLGAVIWSMGALLSAGTTLNLLSILVPVLVLIIGVADGIHLVGRFREELAADGDTEAAMGRTLRHMTVACFLTTFTTAAGFASLLIADTRVIRDFGLHSAIAVMITFFGVILILPVWLAFIPTRFVGAPPTERPGAERRFFSGLDRLVARRPVAVLCVCLALTAAAGFVGSGVRPNSSILEMYRSDHPTALAIERTEQQLSGVVPIFIHVEAIEGDLLEPRILAKIAQLEAELREWDLVRWSTSLPGTISRIHTALGGEGALPDSREGAAQELLLAEMSGELPLGQVTDEDYTHSRILALCSDAGGREFVKMHAVISARAEVLFGDEPVRVDVTGDGLIASLGIGGLISDLLASVGLVFVVILVTMGIMLRDVKLAILSTLPNLAPLLFTLAALWLMGADLQTSNIVSFTVAIGLAVDDT